MSDDQRQKAIDAKLGALLALELDTRLKADTRSRSKPRSLDQLLSDAGLEVSEIARLLGKTQTAVRQAFKKKAGGKRKATTRKATTRKKR